MIDLYKDINKQIGEKTSKKLSKQKLKAIKSRNKEETQTRVKITK